MCLRGFEWKPVLQRCLLAQLSLASTAQTARYPLSPHSATLCCRTLLCSARIIPTLPTYIPAICEDPQWRCAGREAVCPLMVNQRARRGSLATTDSYSTCSNQSLIWGITPVFLRNITLIMTAASTRNVVSSLVAKLFIEESNSLTSKLERLAKLEALYR